MIIFTTVIIIWCILTWLFGYGFACDYIENGDKRSLITSVIVIIMLVSILIGFIHLYNLPIPEETIKFFEEHSEYMDTTLYEPIPELFNFVILFILVIIALCIISYIRYLIVPYEEPEEKYNTLYIDSNWRSFL